MIDDDKLWKRHKVDTCDFDELQEILPTGKSWRENLHVYGELDSNCIQITSDNESVDYMSARVDFRTEYENILAKIVSFANEKHLLILDEHLNILPNNIAEILEVIEESPQVEKWRRLSQGNSSGDNGNIHD